MYMESFLGWFLSHLFYYPVPINLNYFWGFGSVLGGLLVMQMISGMLLAVHYSPDVNLAFYSVEFIMRNVQNGWMVRYIHSAGASLLFIAVYMHMGRGLYFSSFKNASVWMTGLILFLLLMASAFLGYVIVWGQMSLWGATVITNLFGSIPVMGKDLTVMLWGGYSVDNPTLRSFFILHFLLPLAMVLVSMAHLAFLHKKGSTNPLGVDSLENTFFFPKFVIKDLYGFICFYGVGLILLVFYYPNVLGHPDNYMMANAMVTPKHMTPEWYSEPFYAMLSAMPNKLGGVVAMASAMIILFFLPLFEFTLPSCSYSSFAKMLFWSFCANFIFLGWLGMCPMEEPYISLSRFATLWYFFYFLVAMPFMVYMEALL